MRYCPKCQKIYESDAERCEECKKVLKREVLPDDAVFLISAYGFERDRIKAALQDEKIPYTERMAKKESSAQAITGDNNYRVNIYVMYRMLEQAGDVLVGIGAIQPQEEQLDRPQEEEQPEAEEMSGGKRILWRILSVILLIMIVWGVVAGVDQIIAVIKSFL